MVKRAIQIITSKFGLRWKGFHKGIDLRSRDENNRWKQLHIIAPEKLKIKRLVWQDKWGFTIVAKCLESGGVLKFTHIKPRSNVVKGAIIEEGKILGVDMVTPYMEKKGYGAHLHLERWVKGVAINPVRYLKKRNIAWKLKGA